MGACPDALHVLAFIQYDPLEVVLAIGGIWRGELLPLRLLDGRGTWCFTPSNNLQIRLRIQLHRSEFQSSC